MTSVSSTSGASGPSDGSAPAPDLLRIFDVPAAEPPPSLRIAVRVRREEVEINWPAGMPLPQVGDRIAAGELGGFVQMVEYRPLVNCIVFDLR